MNTLARKIAGSLAGLLLLVGVAQAQFTDQRTYGGVSGGSANAQTVTIATMPSTVPQGVVIRFKPGFANTTTATFAVSGGSSAAAFCKPSAAGPVALSGGELQTTQFAEVIWNGTCYLIVSSIDSTASTIVVSPQGRLTLVSGSPVMSGDVTAATAVYYSPYSGNQVPIYNGSRFVVFNFSELTLTLGSAQVANAIYDVCAFNNSGTVRIGTAPAWTTSTAGSGNRGTGAGTAQLARVSGFMTNAVSITATNGASTYSVAANQCTYLGSLLMDGTNGQISATFSWGQNRKFGPWNAYNRVPIIMSMGDSTASWDYATATVRQSNAAAGNTVALFAGLAEEAANITAVQTASTITSAAAQALIGIGINSTTVMSGKVGNAKSPSVAAQPFSDMIASFVQAPFLGRMDVNFLEEGSGTNTGRFFGAAGNMILTVQVRG